MLSCFEDESFLLRVIPFLQHRLVAMFMPQNTIYSQLHFLSIEFMCNN